MDVQLCFMCRFDTSGGLKQILAEVGKLEKLVNLLHFQSLIISLTFKGQFTKNSIGIAPADIDIYLISGWLDYLNFAY